MSRRYREHLQRDGYLYLYNILGYYFPDQPGYDGHFFLQWGASKKKASKYM